MKLREIIKLNQKEITTGRIFIAYEPGKQTRYNKDGYLIDIKDLTKKQLNMEFSERQWWIEDGDLCLDEYK